MSNYIEYAIPTNEDYWGSEDIEIPNAFFDRIEREVAAFVAKNWPAVVFSTRLVPEVMSFNNRTHTSFDDDEELEIVQIIGNWLSTRWPDWLGEALES